MQIRAKTSVDCCEKFHIAAGLVYHVCLSLIRTQPQARGAPSAPGSVADLMLLCAMFPCHREPFIFMQECWNDLTDVSPKKKNVFKGQGFMLLCVLFKLCNHCHISSHNAAARSMHLIRAGLNPSAVCCGQEGAWADFVGQAERWW